jgi:hypothetical protein
MKDYSKAVHELEAQTGKVKGMVANIYYIHYTLYTLYTIYTIYNIYTIYTDWQGLRGGW